MARMYEFEFEAPPEQVYLETLSAVGVLGFSILDSEDMSLTFNTGASIWSNAGQDMTVTAEAVTESSSKLVLSGQNAQSASTARGASAAGSPRVSPPRCAKRSLPTASARTASARRLTHVGSRYDHCAPRDRRNNASRAQERAALRGAHAAAVATRGGGQPAEAIRRRDHGCISGRRATPSTSSSTARARRARDRPPAEARNGDFFGELALIEDAPRSADVLAVDDILALTIERAAFTKLLRSEAALTHAILRTVVRRLRSDQRTPRWQLNNL